MSEPQIIIRRDDDELIIPPVEKTVEELEEIRLAEEAAEKAKNEPPAPKDIVNPDDSEKVDIDGVVYIIDKAGNAVDDKGTVKYTKDQLIELSDAENDNLPVIAIEDITKLTNIVPINDENKPIEYENTQEGIAQYVNDVYQIGANAAIEDLFTKYPYLRDVIQHVNTTGTLKGFAERVDYGKLVLDKSNEDQLVDIVITSRLLKGDSEVSVNNYIKYLKDSGSLYEEAIVEQNYLHSKNVKEQEASQKAALEAQAEELRQAQTTWGVAIDSKGNMVDLKIPNSVYGIITSGNITIGKEQYTIPEKIRVSNNGVTTYKTRQDFFNYLFSPVTTVVNNQKVQTTLHAIDIEEEKTSKSIEGDILDAFKRFVKYDTSQFIIEQIGKKNAEIIMKRYTTKTNKASKGDPGKATKVVLHRE
jgi:hypothetical protein